VQFPTDGDDRFFRRYKSMSRSAEQVRILHRQYSLDERR